jgi:hypothetical protein
LVLETLVFMLLEHRILWGAGREFVPSDPLLLGFMARLKSWVTHFRRVLLARV